MSDLTTNTLRFTLGAKHGLDELQKKPNGVARLGKCRQNRPLTLAHVNKRLKSFTKDYRQYLFTVCKPLQIDSEQIQNFVCKH